MAQPTRHCALLLLLLVPVLLLPAWGCGSGGGTPAPGGGGGGGGGGLPPTATLLAPTVGAAGMLGDVLRFSFLSNADGAAAVTIVADADGDLGTTADQHVLFAGTDGDGLRQDVSVVLASPLVPGAYTLFLQVDDGVHPPLQIVLPAPLVVYRGVAGVAPPRSNRYGVAARAIAFSRGESEDGAGPLNGDGDSTDGVLVVYDLDAGALFQPAPSVSMDVAGAGTPVGVARPLSSESGLLAWFTNEADEGVNLNGANVQNAALIGAPDIDQVDRLLSYLAPAISLTPITNTYAGAASIAGRMSGRIVAPFLEAGEGSFPGTGRDLNGDGDAFDLQLGYIDPGTGGTTHEFNEIVFFSLPATVAAGPAFRAAGQPACAFFVTEVGGPPGIDYNGDGDGLDAFLFVGDLMVAGGAGAPGTFHAFAGFQATPAAPPMAVDATAAFDVSLDLHAGYYIDEGSQNVLPGGALGNDVNGDGIIGFVPAFYAASTLTQTIPVGAAGPINSPAGNVTMVYDAPRLFFSAQEAPRIDPAPGTNGDGNADFAILYWTDHSQPLPTAVPLPVNFGGGSTLQALSLDLGGSVTALNPGWLAVIVSEAANGGQDINGSGALDMAYLLVETGAQPRPVVHNPRIVPSAAGSFPLAGLAGNDAARPDEGVVVRLTEAQNGILDGDGDATETFFAYVSFNTPQAFTLLDAGGDHAAITRGRIVVTANEALTGQDYDGNGSSTDHVFRVFDFEGNVVERGLPCSIYSVPVSETGEVWAYLRDESTEGRDLNGDGDQVDQILGIWIP